MPHVVTSLAAARAFRARPRRPRLWPRLVAVLVGALVYTGVAQATTYYVSPTGSDANAGTSTTSPWRTVAKVDNTCLGPGDTVLFQGGQLFGDSTLDPTCSGTTGSPITFGSYGSGDAQFTQGVWLSGGQHDLVFDSLDLTDASSTIFSSAASGAAVNNVTLQNSVVHDTPYVGVIGQPQDSGWRIVGNTIRHTGDSGIINWSAGMVVSGNTITDTGYAGLSYGTHGIYAKAPNMTISNNDFSNDHGGQAISIRMHGTRVYGNTIHDTPYAIAFFMQDTQTTGTIYIYDNRLWNISGYVFYYSPNGTTSAINAVWDSNDAEITGGGEAVNLSEMQSGAWAEVQNNVFSGSIGSGYRGCPTCSEHNNDWYGVTSNLPSGSADQFVAPLVSLPPLLTPLLGSPLVDSGALSSRITYTALCDGAPLDYCGSMPDLGGVEYPTGGGSGSTPVPDTTPPTAPSALAVSAVGSTGGTLSWQASTDNVGVAGYDVYLNGQRVTTTTGLSYQYAGLTCGTGYTVGVDAYDAAGNQSPTSTATLQTAACPAQPTVTVTSPTSGTKTGLSLTATAGATAPAGLASVTFALDGVTACTDTVAPFSCVLTVKRGWHTLTATVEDATGATASQTVRFDALANRQ